MHCPKDKICITADERSVIRGKNRKRKQSERLNIIFGIISKVELIKDLSEGQNLHNRG